MRQHIARIGTLLLAALVFALPVNARQTLRAFNYCAGVMTYARPPGWVEDMNFNTEYGAFLNIRSAAGASTDDARANLRIEILNRRFLTGIFHLAVDADVAAILERTLVSLRLTAGADAIMTITIQDRLTASAEVGDVRVLVFDVGADAVARMTLVASSGTLAGWQETLLAFAASFTYAAPPIADENAAVLLARRYSSAECRVVFAYPEGWHINASHESSERALDARIANYDERHETLEAGRVRIRFTLWRPDEDRHPADYAEQIRRQSGFDVVSRSDTTIRERPALLMQLSGDNEALGLVIDHGDNGVIVLTLNTAPGELDLWRDTALAVAGSIWVHLPSSE